MSAELERRCGLSAGYLGCETADMEVTCPDRRGAAPQPMPRIAAVRLRNSRIVFGLRPVIAS